MVITIRMVIAVRKRWVVIAVRKRWVVITIGMVIAVRRMGATDVYTFFLLLSLGCSAFYRGYQPCLVPKIRDCWKVSYTTPHLSIHVNILLCLFQHDVNMCM